MRIRLTSRTLCLIFLIVGLSIQSQLFAAAAGTISGTISGMVRDANGIPLSGVAVTLLQGRFNSKAIQTVSTDGSGRFEIKGVLPGLYSLKADLATYIPLIKSGVGVVAGKIAELNLILENLYLQTILGVSTLDGRDSPKEDIESVLRSASSTRPILRIFESQGEDENDSMAASSNRGSLRGMVGFSTAGSSAVPEVATAGNTFTNFALLKELSPGRTLVVAGVMSDAGFAEVDALLNLREWNRHRTSARLSLGILPYLADSLMPLPDRNIRRLNMYNLDLQDEVKVSDVLSVIYGAELQITDPSTHASRFRPRWGFRFQPTAGRQYRFLRTSSLPQMQRTLEIENGDNLLLSSPFQHEFGDRLNFGMNRVTHTEASSSQMLGQKSEFFLGFYSDDFLKDSYLLTAFGAQPFKTSRGARFGYKRSLTKNVQGIVGYTHGTGIESNQDYSELQRKNYEVFSAQLRSEIERSGTQLAATYRWISGNSITMIDPYQDIFESNAPGVSLMLVQAIPYFGRFIPGKLEAELDVRNLLGQTTPELFQSASLRRVEFLQPSRAVRGGIKLKF